MTRRNIVKLIQASIWGWLTGKPAVRESARLPAAEPFTPSTYDREAEMRACVHRHGGLRIVQWIRGQWVAVYEPWAMIEHAVYTGSLSWSIQRG